MKKTNNDILMKLPHGNLKPGKLGFFPNDVGIIINSYASHFMTSHGYLKSWLTKLKPYTNTEAFFTCHIGSDRNCRRKLTAKSVFPCIDMGRNMSLW